VRDLPGTLEGDHEDMRQAAHEAETRYLTAIKLDRGVETLTELASHARDCWIGAARMCALGEDGARARMEGPRLRHRLDVVNGAWSDVRNWAVLGEDAGSRGELLGALATAHSSATRFRSIDLFPVEHAACTPQGDEFAAAEKTRDHTDPVLSLGRCV
jgi:hypothetical protein